MTDLIADLQEPMQAKCRPPAVSHQSNRVCAWYGTDGRFQQFTHRPPGLLPGGPVPCVMVDLPTHAPKLVPEAVNLVSLPKGTPTPVNTVTSVEHGVYGNPPAEAQPQQRRLLA